jgi:hypothetical protein
MPGTKLYDIVGETILPQDYSKINWNGGLLTERLNKLKYHMYHTKNSLVKHGYEKSKMNLNERDINDLKII